MAQVMHESGGLQEMKELSSGKQYEGRSDLGNIKSGDGRRYKGRGFIGLTGRNNYKKYGDMLGIDLVNNPELASDPEIALAIAAAYWKDNGLNRLADKNDIKGITKKINGGYNGLKSRYNYFNAIRSV